MNTRLAGRRAARTREATCAATASTLGRLPFQGTYGHVAEAASNIGWCDPTSPTASVTRRS